VAYEIFLAAGNLDEAGACLQLMAEAQRGAGHDQQAIPLYEQALRTFREAGDREKIGIALTNLSLVLNNEGQWIRAEQNYREALQDFRAVNDKPNTSAVVASVADILFMRGKLTEAADLYRQAWQISDASGRLRHEYPHTQYAALLLMQGDPNKARTEIQAQVDSGRTYGGDPWQLASSLAVLGDLEKTEANFDAARKDYQEALDVLQKFKTPATNGINVPATNGAQISLAQLSIEEGHAGDAEQPIRAAIGVYEKEKSAGNEVVGYTSLSQVLLAQGKTAEVQDAVKTAFKLVDLHGFPALALPLQILEIRAKVAAVKPHPAGRAEIADAENKLHSVIRQAHQLGLYQIECEARVALGEVELKSNSELGRSDLTKLAAEARQHGMELIARKATAFTSNPQASIAAAVPSLSQP
jgi:tetratricopeptide (TPR) repeat protein